MECTVILEAVGGRFNAMPTMVQITNDMKGMAFHTEESAKGLTGLGKMETT